ncbi:MAG: alpha-amylase family glycosyl hydrolase [Burkholderiaceae bacterium]
MAGRCLGGLCLGAVLVAPAWSQQAPISRDQPWADEVLYFVLIDRFADGDARNNIRVDRRNPGGWHGGDFAGLTRQLDELQDLGITALWINPVQRQQPRGMPAQAPGKTGVGEFQHEPFHGYWIDDFETLDPHFGSLDELKTLVAEAHRRGIKVLLDVVYNHTGYTSTLGSRRTASGESWVRIGEGNCEVAPVTCAVGGLPDLKTEIPEVRDYLLGANIALAKASGVDGFRLDTYKHLASEFWAEHRQRTRAELGPRFFLLAEVWGGSAQGLDAIFERDEVDSGFDFSFKGSCEGWVSGRGRTVAYAAYLRNRHQVRPGYVLAHYLSSHDEPMALGDLDGNRARFRVCAALQMTSLGMPVIYYGEEVARDGHEWPLNRNDMPWGERDILPGKGVARDESMREFYKALIRIRKERAALRRGDYTMLTQPPDATLAFARRDATSGDQVVVLANRDDKPASADVAVPSGWTAAGARDALSGERVSTAGGRIKAEMAPTSVRILVPSAE